MPTSLALLTDLYQLTMAYGYWKSKLTHRRAAFHAYFRNNPFQGGFTLACGLSPFIDYLRNFIFAPDDLAYLATLTADDNTPLFDNAFLDYLGNLRLTCDVDAIPEGTPVFPHEPLVRVTGPLLECQLLETPLLNLVNFASLAATKAARVCLAARGQPVLEFGLRRAQGPDGAMTASRAAYIGGCHATSNVLAGKRFGIPVKGTHAHSWVMCFDSELESFHAYADAMPNNCVFLVDSYNTLDGVRHAIDVGKELRASGCRLLGIRLDSGDLAYLSIEARKLLDAAGFPDAQILASNDLDEHIIDSLKDQNAAIDAWGVGTKLVTAFDQPALGGIYKLSAVQNAAGQWQHKIKLSEQRAKISIPGVLQVRRFHSGESGGQILGDMIFDTLTSPSHPDGFRGDRTIIDPLDPIRRKLIPDNATYEDLLVPIFKNGELVYSPPALPAIREHARRQIAALHPGITRNVNPHAYPVGLEKHLDDLRNHLILQLRGLPE
ncbi:MAG TPA: nicotinate phosphoribosyltransferase [Phycisphaerae bacterium]|nr:nicotinate phosphoribosyltransferase [Phycisphaerae bacterium]